MSPSPHKITLRKLTRSMEHVARSGTPDSMRIALEFAAKEIAQQQLISKSGRWLSGSIPGLKSNFYEPLELAQEIPGITSPFIQYLLSVAADGSPEEVRTALFGAIAEINAHQQQSGNKYPLVYWPHDYVAQIVRHPENDFERELARYFSPEDNHLSD